MLIGKHYRDDNLLSSAYAVEQLLKKDSLLDMNANI